MLANSVSPPRGGVSRAISMVAIGGLVQIRRVGVPQPAEIDLLVLELDHRRDLRKALEPLHERIFDRLAEAAREREELRGLERLVAEEDDEVFEPGGADRRDRLVAHVSAEIDPENFRAERAGERTDVERVGCHGGNSSAPCAQDARAHASGEPEKAAHRRDRGFGVLLFRLGKGPGRSGAREQHRVSRPCAPETGSFTASSLTSVISDSGSATGFRFQNSILRPRLAVPASLSSVSVLEPERSTRRLAVFSRMGMAVSPGKAPGSTIARPAPRVCRGAAIRQGGVDARNGASRTIARAPAGRAAHGAASCARPPRSARRRRDW